MNDNGWFQARFILRTLFRGYLDQKAGKPMKTPLSKELFEEFDKIGITEENLDEKVNEYTKKIMEDCCYGND